MSRGKAGRPQSTIAPLTPKQLRGIAAELLRIGKEHPVGLYSSKFLERAQDLRAAAAAIEQRARERRWYAVHPREWIRDR